MKTFGIVSTQELITLHLDENGNPIFDRPSHVDDDWMPPAVVPLIKLPQPTITQTQRVEATLQWFDDRVERQWQIIDLEGEELAAAIRKTWPNVQSFMAEFTMQEKAQIALSMEPTIAALRLELTTWLSEVHVDDPRVVMGLSKLVELGIISDQRKIEITSTP